MYFKGIKSVKDTTCKEVKCIFLENTCNDLTYHDLHSCTCVHKNVVDKEVVIVHHSIPLYFIHFYIALTDLINEVY